MKFMYLESFVFLLLLSPVHKLDLSSGKTCIQFYSLKSTKLTNMKVSEYESWQKWGISLQINSHFMWFAEMFCWVF